MTKEELKQKAYEYAIKEIPFIECITQNDLEILVQQAYITGAEPREKRIVELEKENAELKNLNVELKGMYAHSAREAGTYKQFFEQKEKENAELKEKLKTAYRKGMRHMAKALKDYDRTDGAWTDYFEHTVDKVLQREQLDFEKYGTLADQLTKAKEIIKDLLNLPFASNEEVFADVGSHLYKAEQFISEVEK